MSELAVLPQCDKDFQEMRDAITKLDDIVRGSNGEGLTSRVKVLQDRIDTIYKLMWLVMAGVLGLVIERIVAHVMI